MIDGELVARRLERFAAGGAAPRAAWPGRAPASSAGTAASGSQAMQHVDRRQALVVHAPAVVQMMVDGDLDDLGGDGAAGVLEACRRRSSQSRLRMTSAARIASAASERRRDGAGRAGMQRMIGREGGGDLQIGDDARVEPLGERDARVPRRFELRETRPARITGCLALPQQFGRGLDDDRGGRRARDRRHVALACRSARPARRASPPACRRRD